MKTRNRGEEFLRDRLAHLAHHVGSRSAAAVLAGLKGSAIVDEAGKCGLDSRSSTGLTTPGPTDNAVAWCALWGISALPTIHRLVADSSSAGMSQSPGTWPRNRVHPHYFGVPVFTEATTRGRWSAIVTSRPFDDVFKALTRTAGVEDAAPGHAPAGAPASWLREQGVRAIVVFECQVVGSKSAPERRLLTGRVHPL
jgi:CRISPR-associated protein Csb3